MRLRLKTIQRVLKDLTEILEEKTNFKVQIMEKDSIGMEVILKIKLSQLKDVYYEFKSNDKTLQYLKQRKESVMKEKSLNLLQFKQQIEIIDEKEYCILSQTFQMNKASILKLSSLINSRDKDSRDLGVILFNQQKLTDVL